ncbi:hypothetical protein PFICI_00305 [Pestalotiopsis fici W106-1]|uniref:Uncharacterized protein n=1 Tax=Pestalotiopsis fici (strain W106-1 / CGMCC3.15140) TaxID=1229662 RepID=W3XLX0_PESFW|nr:uncharacterized protein PFICI_00305 [Pestalotiopsis fici W106-1]ETS86477.1 hypothetical protein PFICI_00305 [Pestalotiopsis fici W106-1]
MSEQRSDNITGIESDPYIDWVEHTGEDMMNLNQLAMLPNSKHPINPVFVSLDLNWSIDSGRINQIGFAFFDTRELYMPWTHGPPVFVRTYDIEGETPASSLSNVPPTRIRQSDIRLVIMHNLCMPNMDKNGTKWRNVVLTGQNIRRNLFLLWSCVGLNVKAICPVMAVLDLEVLSPQLIPKQIMHRTFTEEENTGNKLRDLLRELGLRINHRELGNAGMDAKNALYATLTLAVRHWTADDVRHDRHAWGNIAGFINSVDWIFSAGEDYILEPFAASTTAVGVEGGALEVHLATPPSRSLVDIQAIRRYIADRDDPKTAVRRFVQASHNIRFVRPGNDHTVLPTGVPQLPN